MAGELVYKDAWVKIHSSTAWGSGTNWRDNVVSVTINYSKELKDKTAMGSSGRKRIAGLADGSFTLGFNQAFTTSIDKLLFTYVGTTMRLGVRPTTATVSKTNPVYHGNVILESYTPLSGTVGDLATVNVTFQGNGIIKRSTAST